MQRAAFLDRDGVVNREVGYLHRWADFEFLPGVLGAMRALHRAGYALVIVTNQSGIARGHYTEADYQQLSTHLRQALSDAGCPATAIYHCPHHPAGTVTELAIDCGCRKPHPGMLLQAQREWDLDLAASIMVGDKRADAQAGRAAGVGRVFLVCSGHALEPGAEQDADAVHADLAACVSALGLRA
jgi:D-glycero-D-manno-heptose 1,7-bisphosphate phosphatase